MELLRGFFVDRLTRRHAGKAEDLTHVEYHVKPDSQRDLSLIFGTREEARQYKRLLARSRYQISSVIIRREWDDGLVADERIVS